HGGACLAGRGPRGIFARLVAGGPARGPAQRRGYPRGRQRQHRRDQCVPRAGQRHRRCGAACRCDERAVAVPVSPGASGRGVPRESSARVANAAHADRRVSDTRAQLPMLAWFQGRQGHRHDRRRGGGACADATWDLHWRLDCFFRGQPLRVGGVDRGGGCAAGQRCGVAGRGWRPLRVDVLDFSVPRCDGDLEASDKHSTAQERHRASRVGRI
ncbi:uncharacterized protein METZ01_LOCUS225258, partial [marine metagenome]